MIPNNRQAKIKQSGTQFWNITVILPFTNNFTIKHSKRNFAFLLSWCQVSEIVSVIMNLTYLHCYISQIICYSKLSIIFFSTFRWKISVVHEQIGIDEVKCISYWLKYFTVFSYSIRYFYIYLQKLCNFIWWFNLLINHFSKSVTNEPCKYAFFHFCNFLKILIDLINKWTFPSRWPSLKCSPLLKGGKKISLPIRFKSKNLGWNISALVQNSYL